MSKLLKTELKTAFRQLRLPAFWRASRSAERAGRQRELEL
jgi:hypothetical protein